MLKSFSLRSALAISAILSFFLLSAGCLGNGSKKDGLTIARLHLESKGQFGSLAVETVQLPVSGALIQVSTEPLISEFEILNAEVVQVDLGKALLLQLNEQGARQLYRTSVSQRMRRLVLEVNGNPIGARVLDGPIQDGLLYTFVEVDESELYELVASIKETILELRGTR